MMSKKLEAILNDQVNYEYYSSYLYLSMAAYFKSSNLNGMANWMTVQTQEEIVHGAGLYNYIIQRGGKVVLEAIAKPQTSWKSPLDAFKTALEHEQSVTARINNIAAAASKENDFALLNFIQWYVGEQVEEEGNVTQIISELEMVGDGKGGLFMIDKDLSTRVFNLPVIPGAGIGGPAA